MLKFNDKDSRPPQTAGETRRGNLYLQITPTGTKMRVFLYRINGKCREEIDMEQCMDQSGQNGWEYPVENTILL